ncbi:MAG: ATP-dependent helicase C-terminal domain-containing protein [Planctomycetaceae bacterium]
MPIALPVDEVLPAITEALKSSHAVVLKAPAGAGKTTRVPPALLNAGLAGSGQIIMLEPRRIAARTSAARIASERGERTGQTVGFRIRFEDCVSRDTKILVVTEGVLLRRIQDDPFLDGISVVVFDEFHERRLDSDLALAMVRRVQQTVRPDLKIVVMSATMEPGPIANWLEGCPIVESQGRLFPVRTEYLRRVDRQSLQELVTSGVETALERTDGDVLVFLPGVGEILRCRTELEATARRHNLALMTLFGEMTSDDQDRVLAPSSQRKVILSTNVAETSITIDGVTAVVDSGLARQMLFDADVGLDRLELVPISQASSDQRTGRAGRTAPGYCLRLWEESGQRRRPEFDTAELHRVDLSAAILRLLSWGEADVRAFPWFEAPPEASIDHAIRLLTLLGAVGPNGVTERGIRLSRFPAPPRIARLLEDAATHPDTVPRACLMAAMLSERDPFLRSGPVRGNERSRDNSPRTTEIHRSRSDVIDRLYALEDYLHDGKTQSAFGEIHRNAARTIAQAAQQFERLVHEEFPRRNQRTARTSEDSLLDGNTPDECLMQALLAGFPDRVARRRDATSDKGLMVGGRGVRLGPRSAVQKAPLFLCVDIDGAGTDATVRQASEILQEWLPGAMIRESEELFFHPTQKQVVARLRTTFADLVLEETPTAIQDSQQAAEVLFRAALNQIGGLVPVDDESWTSFVQRTRCLKEWMPEAAFPAVDEQMLADVLKELCHGRRSFNELKAAPWLATVQSRYDYSTLQMIEREAPEKLLVPSGSRIKLTYETGRPPVLAVRIQEVFGMTQTPKIAGGRVNVLLHLLAPNFRPQQITEDLASFWKNTYPEVKKELKRRYPKHSWPDDPLTAPAVKKG